MEIIVREITKFTPMMHIRANTTVFVVDELCR